MWETPSTGGTSQPSVRNAVARAVRYATMVEASCGREGRQGCGDREVLGSRWTVRWYIRSGTQPYRTRGIINPGAGDVCAMGGILASVDAMRMLPILSIAVAAILALACGGRSRSVSEGPVVESEAHGDGGPALRLCRPRPRRGLGRVGSGTWGSRSGLQESVWQKSSNRVQLVSGARIPHSDRQSQRRNSLLESTKRPHHDSRQEDTGECC